MACPCFYPVERLATAVKTPAPLGDAWAGPCRAAPDAEWQPDRATLERLCNFGYARAQCPRFPAAETPDAVRFSVSRDQDGIVGIYWVMEKNHMPFAHGALDYSRAAAGFPSAHPDACVAQQAQAYVSSYLRRKDNHARA